MNLSTELKLHYSTHSSLFKAFLVLSPQAEKKNTGKEKKIEKNKHSQCVKNRMSLPVENKLPEATRSMSETRSWSIFFHQTHNLLVIVIKQKQVGGY